MALRVVQTNDQSHTVFDPVLNETYHSTHGAIQESRHVFIGAGLMHIVQKLNSISVLEIGFGTGLNALLTLMEAETLGKPVEYTAIEAFPLERDTWEQLNYPLRLCSIDYTAIFGKLHLAPWGMTEEISRYFRLHKIHQKLEDYSPLLECFDLVYFDAFSPATQPELWTACIFIKLYNTMKPGGILVTYSAKGEVRRAMKTAGFLVEKLPGPPGKRHILRATKNS
ncbi:MAG: tRNA (5-methylaminomethyl-2-thiouridine)(34)-methyltransferase MnmD [Bacteroidetes bacterium]|nr:tRNA (5-methylaminomethyl-2-thiouridine)(34)-methyltransferase MnmD [Bacteroidota bacterium]